MGDIVLTTPVIRCLRKAQPDAELHFVCKSVFSSLLEANPHIDRILSFEKKPSELIDQLKQENYDHVIDLQKNRRSAQLIRALGKPASRLNKLNIKKWIFVNFGWNLLGDSHIVQRYLDTASSLGVKDDGAGLDYHIPQGTNIETALPEKFVLFALGGAHEGKRMTTSQWIDLINDTEHSIVLIGGNNDRADADEIVAETGPKTLDQVGKLNIHQSALLAKKASLVVCGDTGMMHISSAFQTPVISIWGCTVPELGMSAYRPYTGSKSIEPLHRPKRPCSKLGNRCKYGMENKCITQINTQEILQSINSLLEA